MRGLMGLVRGGLLLMMMVAAQMGAAGEEVAAKRAITEKDLFAFQWIGAVRVSPDGSRAVFVKATVDAKREGYATSLWVIDLAAEGAVARQITNGPRDGQPAWSPDGTQLAFVRAGEKDGKPAPGQIHLMSFVGGEPHAVTSLARGASGPVWSPDGKRIAFFSDTDAKDLAKELVKEAGKEADKKAADKDKKAAEAEHESDVRVITHATYRRNGEGYLDYARPSHLWVMDVPAGDGVAAKPRQLTSGRFNDEDAVWAKDSKGIYYLSERVDEPEFSAPRNDLYSVTVGEAVVTQVAAFPYAAHGLSLSGDGRRMAFHADVNEPVRSYSQPDLFVLELGSKAGARNLTAEYDFDMGGGVGGDNAAPRGGGGGAPVWSADGGTILDLVAKEGHAELVTVDAATGRVTQLTYGKHAVQGYSASADGMRVVALISSPVNIGDLFVISASGEERALTHVNAELFGKLNLSEPEEIWYRSFDGRRIEAWIQKPADFDAKKKYPLILNIHGGPHSAYGWVFDHEFQWMAAKGYVVLYPNPRGSTSYGQEFGNIIQHRYPGDDYKDLMSGVDELIRRGYIDEQKLGVTGGSGGGLLTDWTVTQTTRFKAAVAQRDISDWTSWWYTADFTLFQPTWFKGAPFDEPADFRDRSPITYVKKIETPMMFILGEADYRTPPGSGGEQLFRALKYRKIPTVMVRFPGESHELSRSGQPWHRVERLENIVGWFDKYLKGEAKPEYELAGQ